MKKAEAIEFGAVMAALIMQYGVPAAMQIIQAWNDDDISLEKIQALRMLVRPPEYYFPSFAKPAEVKP